MDTTNGRILPPTTALFLSLHIEMIYLCTAEYDGRENGFVFNNGIFNWATCRTSPIDTKHVY